MTHDGGRALAEGVHDAEIVVDVVQHPVRLDLEGRRRPPIPAHVDGYGPEAGRGDGGQLVAPRVPRFGEAVHQDHQRASTFLDQMDAGAAGVDQVVLHRGEVSALRKTTSAKEMAAATAEIPRFPYSKRHVCRSAVAAAVSFWPGCFAVGA